MITHALHDRMGIERQRKERLSLTTEHDEVSTQTESTGKRQQHDEDVEGRDVGG